MSNLFYEGRLEAIDEVREVTHSLAIQNFVLVDVSGKKACFQIRRTRTSNDLGLLDGYNTGDWLRVHFTINWNQPYNNLVAYRIESA